MCKVPSYVLMTAGSSKEINNDKTKKDWENCSMDQGACGQTVFDIGSTRGQV